MLKSFAKELDLPLSYEVEMNTDLALSETIENLFRQLEDHKEIRLWLNNYVKDRLDSDKGWNVDWHIHKLGKNLFNEAFQEGFKGNKTSLDQLDHVIGELKKQKKLFEQTAKSYAKTAFNILSAHGLTFEDFNYKKSGPLAAFYALERDQFDPDTKSRFVAALNGESNWGAKKSERFELANQVGNDELHPLGVSLLDYVLEQRPKYNTATAILKNIYSYGLLEAIDQKLKEYRDEHNVMLISDTNSILREIMQEGDAPFIFEKIGSFFKHIMIDEFQDTSNYQWLNIKPLIINALSEGQEVLIVGDVKQSIYRFRGGNMRLLLTQIKQELQFFYDQNSNRELSTNYRSAKEIVHFNNKLFDKLPKAFEANEVLQGTQLLSAAFEGHQQEIHHKSRGYVSFKFFDEDWKTQSVEHLIGTVNANIQNGYQYADMLVLVNRNGEIAEIATALLKSNIPFINGVSLRLIQSDLVQFLLQILGYLNADNDKLRRLELVVLFQRLKGRPIQDVFELEERGKVELLSSGFPESFFHRVQQLKQLSIFELIAELLILFEFENVADIYLQHFLDLILEQSQKGIHSISAFLEWWEKEGDNQTISTSEQANAVKILSIHKSKGLESPIVLIPFVNWDILPNAALHQFWTKQIPEEYSELKFIPLDFNKKRLVDSQFKEAFYQEAEEGALDILNKTYVAFTRPREKLYLNAPIPSKGASKIHQLLEPILSEVGMINSEEDYGKHFQLGSDHNATEKKATVEDARTISVYPASSYLDQLAIRNDSERFFMLQDNQQAKNISIGNQVHDVLADVKQEDDLDMVLRQRLQSGEMDRQTIEQVRIRILQLFQIDTVKPWFNGDYSVMNERSLWFEGKELKPDRLMFRGDHVVVIDYKKEVEDDKHLNQVKGYMHGVIAMGYKSVSGYLIYVESGKVKEVKL